MAMWSIVLTEQFKANSGSSAENVEERVDLERFKVQMDEWERMSHRITDPHLAKAWASNFSGLKTHVTSSSRGDHLFRVRQSTTEVTYLLGKLSKTKWALDLSEVISSTVHADDLARFEAEVDREESSNPMQTARSIGAMRTKINASRTDIRESVPLGCLFAWAANSARNVTLTANTVGLIGLYERYGFELSAPNVVTQRARETVEKRKAELDGAGDKEAATSAYNDAKFAVVNALMTLSGRGRELLQARYRPLVNFIGPSLA